MDPLDEILFGDDTPAPKKRGRKPVVWQRISEEFSQDRRERFIAEYLKTLNSRAAATAAGYSESNSKKWGIFLLRHPYVKRRLQEEFAARRERCRATVDRVIGELSLIAFADITDFVDVLPHGVTVKDLSRPAPKRLRASGAIAQITQTETKMGTNITVKLHDKIAALTTLAKHLGLLTNDESGATLEKFRDAVKSLAASGGAHK